MTTTLVDQAPHQIMRHPFSLYKMEILSSRQESVLFNRRGVGLSSVPGQQTYHMPYFFTSTTNENLPTTVQMNMRTAGTNCFQDQTAPVFLVHPSYYPQLFPAPAINQSYPPLEAAACEESAKMGKGHPATSRRRYHPRREDGSEVSSLESGSIDRVAFHAASQNPPQESMPAHPPQEIRIRLKAPVRSDAQVKAEEAESFQVPDWLRGISNHNHSSSSSIGGSKCSPPTTPTRRTRTGLSRGASYSHSSSFQHAPGSPAQTLVVNGKEKSSVAYRLPGEEPVVVKISVGSIVGQSSFRTVPTDTSSSGSSSTLTDLQEFFQYREATKFVLTGHDKRGNSFVRRELNHVWNRIKSPFKKRQVPKLSRAKGCLT